MSEQGKPPLILDMETDGEKPVMIVIDPLRTHIETMQGASDMSDQDKQSMSEQAEPGLVTLVRDLTDAAMARMLAATDNTILRLRQELAGINQLPEPIKQQIDAAIEIARRGVQMDITALMEGLSRKLIDYDDDPEGE